MIEEELNFEEIREQVKELAKETIKETQESKEGIGNLKFIILKLQASSNPPPFFKKTREEAQEMLDKVNKELKTLEEAEAISFVVLDELKRLGKELIQREDGVSWSDEDVFTLGVQMGRMHRINRLLKIAKQETEGALILFAYSANPSIKDEKEKKAQELKELSQDLKENSELLRMSSIKKIKVLAVKIPKARKSRISETEDTLREASQLIKIIKEESNKNAEIATKKEVAEIMQEFENIQEKGLEIIEVLKAQGKAPKDEEELKDWTVKLVHETAVESEKLADLILNLEHQKKRIRTILKSAQTPKLKS